MSQVTQDTLLDGKVTIFQPATGFRAGLDSVLLGAGVAGLGAGVRRALEIGCGVGGALFPAAFGLPEIDFTGLEQDAGVAELAQRGILANGFDGRVSCIAGEAGAYVKGHENAFDLVFSNPPYFQAGHIKMPGAGKQSAYIEGMSLDDWLKAMLFATRPRGKIVLIHRAAELARILARLDKQAGEICVLPIRPYPGAKANRVLISARKGLRSGDVTLLAGLDVHVAKGGALGERAERVMSDGSFLWT